MRERSLPVGRLGRIARLAAAGARGALRRDDVSARDLADTLGTLRGLAAKMGQMASYVDGIAPEGEGWESAMGTLQAATAASPAAEIRRVVEEELGQPVDRLFLEWDDAPLASASIGQVHRARLADGSPVAVKVQHPGAAAAVENDLRNGALIERAVGMMVGGRIPSREAFEDISIRFREELDYRAEADYQERFRAIHHGDPKIRIPPVIRDRSARRVLTTAFAEGARFEVACAAPEAERRLWCRTLWRFVFKGTVTAGLFNADPHPGNYLFEDNGTVVFLDFGCVQDRTEPLRAADEVMHRAALARDEAAFAAGVRQLLGLAPGEQEQRVVRQLRRMFEPLFRGSFRIDRAYAADLLAHMREISRAALRSGQALTRLPRGTIMMNRLQFGFYSVLARLDADVDYAAVEREFLGG